MSEPLDFDADDKKKLSQLEKKRKDAQIRDLKRVLEIPEGRRLVWRILSESGVYRGSFNQNALVMGFNEGKRDLGLLLIGEINAHVSHRLTQMQNEYASEQKIEKAEKAKILSDDASGIE